MMIDAQEPGTSNWSLFFQIACGVAIGYALGASVGGHDVYGYAGAVVIGFLFSVPHLITARRRAREYSALVKRANDEIYGRGNQ